jgi:hypothetical protein
MKETFIARCALILCLVAVTPALARNVTGVPGSPGTTTTIDGKQLPPEPPKFGGALTPWPDVLPKWDSLSFLPIDETFDIGSDARTTVDDSDKLPFHFTGKIDKVTYTLGFPQMTNDEQKRMRHALERARD